MHLRLTVLMVLLTVGCDFPQRPPLRPLTAEDFATPVDPVEADLAAASGGLDHGALGKGGLDQGGLDQPPAAARPTEWEAWDSFFFGNQQVGYNHIVVRTDELSDSDTAKFSIETVLIVQQGRARTIQRWQQSGTETAQGQLVDFEGTSQLGPMVTAFRGQVTSDPNDRQQLEVETIQAGNKAVRSLDWNARYRGFMAVEQSLRGEPLLEKGATRSIQFLLPKSYAVAVANLVCRGEASVPMLDGTIRRLAEIQCVVSTGQGGTNYLTFWINDEGEIMRSHSAGINMVAYRTDKTAAEKLKLPSSALLAVPVVKQIDQPSRAKRVGFEVTPLTVAKTEATEKEVDNKKIVIRPAWGQVVRKQADGRFQVVVTRGEALQVPGFDSWDDEPNPQDRRANSIVDSNDPLVRRFAHSLSRKLSQQSLARELTRTVHDLIEFDPQASGLQSASSVARDGRGGVIGRAVLLAAMLRARNIPTRVAFGLRYHQGPPTEMIFHAWVLAHVGNRWRRFDVEAVGEDQDLLDVDFDSSPDRLTLVTSDLQESNPNDLLRQLMVDVGRMKLKIMRAQY